MNIPTVNEIAEDRDTNLLVFYYDGNDNKTIIVRSIRISDIPFLQAQFEDAECSINGMVELHPDQMNFKNTHIMKPPRYLVFSATGDDKDGFMWLDEVPSYSFQEGFNLEIGRQSQDANKVIDELEAEAEAMFGSDEGDETESSD